MPRDISEITFDDMVKRQKAAEWLLCNDPWVAAIRCRMEDSPVMAVMLAGQFGVELQGRILKTADDMVVTEDDRRFGYPRSFDSETVLPSDLTYRV